MLKVLRPIKNRLRPIKQKLKQWILLGRKNRHPQAVCACGRPLNQAWVCPHCRNICPNCHRALEIGDTCERCHPPPPPFPVQSFARDPPPLSPLSDSTQTSTDIASSAPLPPPATSPKVLVTDLPKATTVV